MHRVGIAEAAGAGAAGAGAVAVADVETGAGWGRGRSERDYKRETQLPPTKRTRRRSVNSHQPPQLAATSQLPTPRHELSGVPDVRGGGGGGGAGGGRRAGRRGAGAEARRGGAGLRLRRAARRGLRRRLRLRPRPLRPARRLLRLPRLPRAPRLLQGRRAHRREGGISGLLVFGVPVRGIQQVGVRRLPARLQQVGLQCLSQLRLLQGAVSLPLLVISSSADKVINCWRTHFLMGNAEDIQHGLHCFKT